MSDQKFPIAMPHEGIHVLTRHETRCDEIAWQRLVAQDLDRGKEQRACHAFKKTAASAFLNSVDNVAVSLCEALMEPREILGLFFQIAVDQKYQVAGRVGKTGHHRLVVTEIAGEIDDHQTRIGLLQRKREFK